MGRYRQWGSWTERGVILNVDGMLRVAEERTLAGRLFQMVEAAGRKPRVPNDKLHRVTDNRLAEADRKGLHGVCRWSRLARYGGLAYRY